MNRKHVQIEKHYEKVRQRIEQHEGRLQARDVANIIDGLKLYNPELELRNEALRRKSEELEQELKNMEESYNLTLGKLMTEKSHLMNVLVVRTREVEDFKKQLENENTINGANFVLYVRVIL